MVRQDQQIQEWFNVAQKASRKYFFLDKEDLIQEALLTIIRIQSDEKTSFKEEKGSTFTAYAATCIHNSLKALLYKDYKDGAATKITNAIKISVLQENGIDVPSKDWTEEIDEFVDAAQKFSQFISLLTQEEQMLVRMKLKKASPSEILSEISKIRSISQPTLSRMLKRCRAKFKIAFGV